MKSEINIFALATAPFNSALHIIRFSGPDVYEILNKITNKKITRKGMQIQRTWIVDENNKRIDDVLLFKFVSPNSYTGEDLIEISCHGNMLIVNEICALLLKKGGVYAKPGEFTQRSFLNGKMSLQQASAVNKLILSPNLLVKDIVLNNLAGEMDQQLEQIAQQVNQLVMQMEVNIDYPEYLDEQVELSTLNNKVKLIIEKLKRIIENSKQLKKLHDPFKIAIIGETNVGKSSLLNALLNQDKAIVSNIKGSTRDVVEGDFNLNGYLIKILDTAGIRKHKSGLEKAGIKKSFESIKQANLVIYLLDATHPKKDLELISFFKKNKKDFFVFYNKKDLITNKFENSISAKQKDIKELVDLLTKYINEFYKKIDQKIYLIENWQQILIEKIKEQLEQFLKQQKKYLFFDVLVTHLREAQQDILKLLGKDVGFDLVNEIFNNFCLGK
ncbi:tRNA uridine-5-carboxymethylaminomethyl(34) synthesis GTPase MnmE [Mycoplasmoides genitalium]|uniref:tRNA modification GTPase MnmE n=3 Tax=Mycoplasmoides genitalium TaxID=2097 RepID=MNME_MYCGE|nr:tRNA uridine-5-carboxymethylaminomethyl(34) synthesis GTPase MnmE [Mycoplasmoides genitalium]P47254.1 RecName: Full=tRNA modification GTPase MnmE [Mycoplasmoides genitalium G37]ABY79400.1 tRNA modification GTPase TrmE [synthetic Mycoplasma genitalium JCVI-1.0]AAC71224.1 tRNA modification GTPase TrmE [Mycoplasmoides genitalium G37]AFQ02819.1 tRNA modification GTPase TrmE [Mycoplasmoides genitalium M2321]AFQ03802.1 tRNA modification GTPase TrmE [Mycoplasmoides genitalium M6320]